MHRFASGSVSVLLVIASFTSSGLADEGSIAKADLDGRIDKAVYEAINAGVPVYNLGDAAGCYRIYQGALITVSPFLAHRPDLQESVKKALASTQTLGSYDQKARTLRASLDEIRYKVTVKTLWTRLGGEPAVKAVVHDFVLKAAGDSKVNFFRDGKYKLDDAGVAHLEELLVQLVSQVTGGPLKYTGRAMKPVHEGMGITDTEFSAIAEDLVEVLKSYKVPEKEINDLVGIIASTKKDIVEPPRPINPNSLWARLGGEPAVKAVVHDFVAKAATDPKVDFTRGGKYSLDAAAVTHFEELIVQFVSSVSGGPLKYTGRDMKTSHAGMKITEEQFAAIAADLIEVLKTYKVPEKEISELIDLVATTKKDIVETP
jgi:truncated hemoglobin YjbI